MKTIYLTIDDGPSSFTYKKIEALRSQHIPAVFFCRGENIIEYKDQLINAIHQGFLIGNHSYSHPYFSQIPLSVCFQEILRTEQLIDSCYREANKKRPRKVIRLPFGDRGAGADACLPRSNDEKKKVAELQKFLSIEGFVPIDFGSDYSDGFIDAYWTWDTKDYKRTMIADPNAFRLALELHWRESSRRSEIMLLHDFETNHHLFEITIDFLLQMQAAFGFI